MGAGTRLFHSLVSYLMLAATYLFAKPCQDRHVRQQNCQAADMHPCENQTPPEILHASSDTNGQAADEGGEGEDKADHCAEQAICKGGAELTDTTSENSSAQKAKHQKTRGKGGHKNQQRKKGSKGKGGGKGDVDGNGKGESEDKGDGKGGTTGADIVQGLAGGMGSKLALALLLGLGLAFSDKANALYGLSDMYRLLLSVYCREGNEPSVSAQYERSKRIRGAPNLPSRQWAYDIIREVRYDFMLKRCRDKITRSMVKARRHGMLRRPVDVSIGYHDIPFYAKVMRKIFAVFSEYKRGTDQFNRLATLHCVVDGKRLTLGVEVFRKESDTNAIVVRRLLYRCSRGGIRMSSVTVDRGFHAVDVLEIIKNMGIPVVMPAVKLKRVKEAIIQYDAGEREAIAPHSMTSASGQTTSYTLVIIERERKDRARMTEETRRLAELHDKDAHISDHYYVFATTMPDSWIGGDPHRVADFYRRRWGIENSYKSYDKLYERTRPRTTSTSYSVRILLWILPFALYNIWILARFMAARQEADGSTDPPVTLKLFLSMLLDAATVHCLISRAPD